jgi:thiol:disulfide interchange protein
MLRNAILAGFCLALGLAMPGRAASGPHVQNAELVSETVSIQPGRPLTVALWLKLEPHWHVYWKNPGDSGLAPTLQWKLPEGFKAGEILWPVPQRIEVPPLVSFGYEDEVLLPVVIEVSPNIKPGARVTLAAKVDWLVCRETCIPGSADLQLTLPVAADVPKGDPAWGNRIEAVRKALPKAGETLAEARVEGDSLVLSVGMLSAEGSDPGPSANLFFFPDGEGWIKNAEPQRWTKERKFWQGRIALDKNNAPPRQIQGILVRGTDAWEIKTVLTDAGGAASASAPRPLGFGLALGFAFVGGLILNLMPCVLPVLSLKIFSLVQQAGGDRRASFEHGLVFTAGVLASFLALAGLLLALRAGGQQLGWGFQLQSPLFVFLLAALLFAFSLNLFGVFEVGASLISLAGATPQKNPWLDSFLSGVLATVVATPCTAPFMGSALGFALTQPPVFSLLIFAALGMGMAAPYLLLSARPDWLKFLPKPGAWMDTFKKLLGFPMLLTVVWLLWVLGVQRGADAMALLLSVLVVLGLGLWLYGKQHFVVAAVLVLASLGFGWVKIDALPPVSAGGAVQEADGFQWEVFDEKRVAELRAAGTPVFIDFTAAWCLSCQVNHRVAFTEDVRREFKTRGVVAMKADWTNRDERITRALASFGRSGVPFYVLYGRNPAEPPHILPEVLTSGIVLNALDKL